MFLKILTTAFFLSLAVANSENKRPKSSTHDLIRHLLNQDLGTRKFLFSDIVFATSGKKVISCDANDVASKIILNSIFKAASECLVELSTVESPVRKLRRINEASRFFEDLLLVKINRAPSLTCSIPINAQGKTQRSGYPDLLITHTSKNGSLTHAYLDPKLFEVGSQSSSLRTFYYEPRTHTHKIQYDAMHLLLGIKHNGKDGQWVFTGWKLCDLSQFQVRLKAEFQASNRDIYRPHLIIKASE